jgi:hypothetical protein
MSTVVTLLTSGAVGAILAAVLRARFEREHEWRRSLSEAAAEFSARLAGAANAVRYAVDLAERAPTRDKLDRAVDDANHLANEAVVSLARVRLLFFSDPPAQTAATVAFEKLRDAAASLRVSSDPESARALYAESEAQLESFTNLVSKSLRKSIWLAA